MSIRTSPATATRRMLFERSDCVSITGLFMSTVALALMKAARPFPYRWSASKATPLLIRFYGRRCDRFVISSLQFSLALLRRV